MKKKIITLLMAVCLIFAFVACSNDGGTGANVGSRDEAITETALANLADGRDVYYTTIGQGDYAAGENLLKQAGLQTGDYTADKLLTAAEAKAGGDALVFIVAAGSGKGLVGSVTQDSEITRANAFVAAAEANEIKIVVLHVGNSASRGSLSDPFIRAIVPGASVVLVRDNGGDNGGNYDGLFSTLTDENDIPFYMYSTSAKLVDPIKHILGK